MRPGAFIRRGVALGLLALGTFLPSGTFADLAIYPWLGVFPGLLLVEALAGRASRLTRWSLALAAAPLVSALCGSALMAAGVEPVTAARSVAGSAAFLWLVLGAIPRGEGDGRTDEPVPRFVWGLSIGLAIVVLAPPLLNRYVAVRGDTWTHAGIVIEILERGIPPEDPRFAAIPLHYAWFYNLFVVLLSSLRGGGPFSFMTCLNVATAFSTVGLVSLAALHLGLRPEAAKGAAALTVFGLNAGAYVLWPLGFLRALAGDVRGFQDVAAYARTFDWGRGTIIASLSAPFSLMVSFLDKLMLGSPLAYAYLLMILHLWAILRWLEGGRSRDLVWIVAGAAGMMLFHGVVALSVIPVWLGTLVLAMVLRARISWLPSGGRLAAAAAATLAGSLATTPYMLSVSSGWEAKASGLRHSYIAPNLAMAWTLLTACAVVGWFTWRPWLDSWRERRPLAAIVALYLAAMVVFACVVRLPEHNEAKFVFQTFVPAVLLAAPSFWTWFQRVIGAGPARAAMLVLLFLVPVVLTLHGYIADPGRSGDPAIVEPPGAGMLNRWIRERTPTSAIVVDAKFRDLLMVKGRRQLYLGTPFGPERAAFPLAMVLERRRAVADLYGPANDLAADVAALGRMGRPVYVVFRPEDDAEVSRGLLMRSDWFEQVYDHEGYRVLRFLPPRPGSS